jgi:hypothetical protein
MFCFLFYLEVFVEVKKTLYFQTKLQVGVGRAVGGGFRLSRAALSRQPRRSRTSAHWPDRAQRV